MCSVQAVNLAQIGRGSRLFFVQGCGLSGEKYANYHSTHRGEDYGEIRLARQTNQESNPQAGGHSTEAPGCEE